MFHDIDYARLLQPQEDGYDVQIFKQLKRKTGYKEIDYRSDKVFSNLPKLTSHSNRQVVVLPRTKDELLFVNTVNFQTISDEFNTIWPTGYTNVVELVDAYVPDIRDGNYSGQHDGSEFEYLGAWGIMSSLDVTNPSAMFANLIHELMHWKLVTLGFGTHANSFFPTTSEFILNHESELCWSIVNSYADTAQPTVGNKPTDRPVSASLHAYLSFLGVAYTHAQVLKIDPNNYESQFKMKRWGERFDKCLDELWKVGKFTPKGQRLMIGVSKWTADFFYEAKNHKLHLL